MKTRNLSKALAMIIMCLLCASACGRGEEEHSTHTLVISDVSLSGLDTGARLDEVARTVMTSTINNAEPGDVITTYAFGKVLTSACQPITANFSQQGNSEERDQLKANLVASAPELYTSLIKCVRDEQSGGSSDSGSPIFGAIVEAVVEANATAPVDTIHLVTDGCSFGEGVATCTKQMTKPKFAEKLIKLMPPALKPNLSGITLVVTGLGQGSGASSPRLSALRQVFTEYSVATGSTVEFGS